MRLGGQIEKWGVGVLGALSLLLITHLVFQFNQLRARPKYTPVKTSGHAKIGTPPGAKATARKLPLKPRVPDELSNYDSIVKLDVLKEFEESPLPELHRNPFDFVAPPAPPPRVQPVGAAPAAAAAPPPPLNLKVMGYTEGKGAPDEAMVELCASSCDVNSADDQVLVVHAGDPVGSRYKVIKITPTAVSVEDSAVHQTVDLPIPQ